MWNSKKGESWSETVFIPVIHLLVVVAFIFLVLYKINAVTTKKSFDENYMARDISLLIDTMLLAPGDVVFPYTKYLPGYIINVGAEEVKVSHTEQLLTYQAPLAKFVPSLNIPVQQASVAENFIIEKSHSIKLATGTFQTQKTSCEPVFISKPQLIVLDAGYDKEGLAFSLANSFKAMSFMLQSAVVQQTIYQNQELSEEERIQRITYASKADIVLRFKHAAIPNARAFVNQNKASYDLACNILQQLNHPKNIDELQITQGAQGTKKINVPIVIYLELPITKPDRIAQEIMAVLKLHIK